MKTLMFSVRDIFLSPGIGWSSRKISVGFKGIGLAWSIYLIFTYAAMLLTPEGKSEGLESLFRYYEFFPTLIPFIPGIISHLVWYLGILLSFSVLLLTSTAIARIAFEDTRDNVTYQSGESLSFAIRNTAPILIAVFLPVILSFCCFIGLIVFGWFGRLPFLGETGVALLTVPFFFWALAGSGMIVISISAILLTPSIFAVTGEDTLETIIQVCTLVLKRPVSFLAYEFLSLVNALTGTVLLAVMSATSLIGGIYVSGIIMSNSMSSLVTVALYRLPLLMYSRRFVGLIVDLGKRISFDLILPLDAIPAATRVSGWIMGISFLLIGLWIVSYGFSIFQSAQVLFFLSIRKQLSGDDLRLKSHITDFIPEKPDN